MISIYDIQGHVLMQVPITPECEHAEELMRTDEVHLFWNAASNTTIPDGAYVIVGGENYYLVEPYAPTQRKENQWRYEPVFVSAFYALSKVPFYMYTYEGGDPTGTITAREADWVLTTDAATFMDTLCVAIKNETGLRYTYAVAQDLPASKTITFTSVDLISALNAIANAFETEFWLEKYATPDASGNIGCIHLSFANDGASAKVLAVGTNVNVPSVSDGREGFYNRFVVLGSTRNITQDYQGAGVNSVANKRLTLDPTDYPNGYIDYANGSKPYTKILTFDDIYPASNLRIKAVLARTRYVLDDNDNPIVIQPGQGSSPDIYDLYNIYYVKLEQYNETTHDWSDFVFNNTDYDADTNPTGMRLPNMPVSVHFESGPLRGREFELKYLDNPIVSVKDKADTTTFSCPAGYFEIVKTQEGNYIIPSLTGLVPAANDQVILFNIKMPDAYVTGAQERLEAAAFEEIGKNYIKLNADGTAVRDASGNLIRIDKNSYQLASNPVAFSASNPGLKLASAVTYVNGNYSLSTRVKALVTKLDFGFKQTITIGEEITKGPIQELKEAAANANQNIDLLDALNTSTQRLLDAYNRTQELIQARQVDAFLQLNPNRATHVELRDQYNYFGPRKGLIFETTAENDVENSPAHLMLRNFGTAQNPNYALYTPYAIVSAKDQIVLGGTPGGGSGGGGVSWLAELMDVKKNLAPSVNDILVWRNNVSRNDGTTAPGWTNMAKSTFLSGYATQTWVTGQINDILSSVLKFQGTTTTAISDGSTTNPITIDGASYTAQKGDVVLYDGKEYLWQGSAWEQLGDESSWALKTTTISAGTGLAGGGSLSSNRTIRLSDASIASLGHADDAYSYFTNGVANSAARLSGNTAYSVWGVGFWSNGVPKSVTARPNLYVGDTKVATSAQTAMNIGGLGNLAIANGMELRFLDNPDGGTATAINTLKITSANALVLGGGTLAKGYQTAIYGSPIRFYTDAAGGSGATRMRIDTDGTIVPYADIIPYGNRSLGSASAMWKYTYTNRLYLTSSVYLEYVDNSGNGYVHINAPLVTDGDQIVTGGTPGGGSGGGKNYLHELLDVYGNPGDVKRGDGTTRQGGDLLGYNSSLGLWVAVDKTTVGVTTAGTVNELNAANPLTALRVWSPSVLASWLAGKNFLTSAVSNVAVGGTGHTDELAITKNGSTSYLTVPYATNVKRFKRYAGTDEVGGYDLNTLLSGGGITSQYDRSDRWANRPDSMSVGGVLQINPNTSNTLSMQLAWDVVDNRTQEIYKTGKMWWRDYNAITGWGSWHIIYDNASLLLNGAEGGESTLTFYAPTTAGTSGQLLKSGGSGNAPAWTSSALGSATKHVYLNSSGVLTEGDAYAGGTAVTLNGTSQAAGTASFYAPTGAGTSGQLLTSGGSNAAPSWTSSALGASNKPIYLNSSGVLTEGSACVTLAGAQTITGAKTHSANLTLNNAVGLYCKDTNDASVEAVSMSTSNTLRFGYGNRLAGTTGLFGKTFRIGTTDTAAGPDIYIGGLSSTHNTDAANIYFHSTLASGAVRNGVKVAAEHVASADRLNLSVYTSNNTTSPYAPSWNKTLEVTYDGKVNIGAPSFSDGALNVNGAIVSAGDQVIASDERIKRNFKPIELSVEQIASCRAVTFDWASGGHSFGSIAQDWEPILPEAVKDGDVKALAYGQLGLVAAINIARHETEQDKEIRKLKERVKNLEEEVKRLRAN